MSDFIKCNCLHCGQNIEYPSEGTGETVPCPTCGKPVTLTPAIQSQTNDESQSDKTLLQEVTIQEAIKPKSATPHDYTIPAHEVQDFARHPAAQSTSISVPSEKNVDVLLRDCLSSDGCYWLPVMKAANLTQIFDEAEKITISQSRFIADKIQWAGYCVEPDSRFGGGSYGWNQTLGVFKPFDDNSFTPSTAYLGAANLLRLCVLIAAADGQIDEVELDVFRHVIEIQLDLSQTDYLRLQILEKLLVKDSSSASKTLAKVAKSVRAHKRLLIGKVLVRVATADNVITKKEQGVLQRIFKAFEVSLDTLENLIRQACPPSQEVGSSASDERFSKPVVAPAPRNFTLDMDKVYDITNETKEVVGILSVVMQDEPENTIKAPETVVVPALEILKAHSDYKAAIQPTRFNGLDAAFQPVLERLLTRNSWPQADFNALARDFNFMPLKIRDTLNEWADEALGDFILDGENPIVIRRELIAK
jgi:uncharacterized tellurite resistance protein B-like protein